MLPPSLLEQLARSALKNPHTEIIGFISQPTQSSQLQLHPLKNIAPSHLQNQTFQMDPLDLLDILERERRQELSLKILYHSHPSGSINLSKNDQENLTYEQFPLFPTIDLLIIGILDRQTVSFALHSWNPTRQRYQLHRLIRKWICCKSDQLQ